MNLNLIAIAAAAGVAVMAYNAVGTKAVQADRARVEVKAKKTDAQVQEIRRRVAANPDPSGLLAKYWRD